MKNRKGGVRRTLKLGEPQVPAVRISPSAPFKFCGNVGFKKFARAVLSMEAEEGKLNEWIRAQEVVSMGIDITGVNMENNAIKIEAWVKSRSTEGKKYGFCLWKRIPEIVIK